MSADKPEEVIVYSKNIKQAIELAEKIGRNRDRIKLDKPQMLSDNQYVLKFTGGTIENFREMIRGIPSIEIIDGVEINLDSLLPDDPTKLEK